MNRLGVRCRSRINLGQVLLNSVSDLLPYELITRIRYKPFGVGVSQNTFWDDE